MKNKSIVLDKTAISNTAISKNQWMESCAGDIPVVRNGLIQFKMTGSGNRKTVKLTMMANHGIRDRYPAVRADNGVLVTWMDPETKTAYEKLSFDSKSLILRLPLPLGKIILPVNPDERIAASTTVVPSTTDIELGSVRVSEENAAAIEYAILILNRYAFMYGHGGASIGGDYFGELIEVSRNGIIASEKLGVEIERLGEVIDKNLDEVSRCVRVVEETRRKIDYLQSLRMEWEITGDGVPSDIGL